MKVGELREKLSKLKKDEIVKIASEFYKLIPKGKKEDYDIDSLVNREKSDIKKPRKGSDLSILELDAEITKFILDAKEQYYLYPNKIIAKKERSTWRFKVKKWYKELINTKRADSNKEKQLELLISLYELLCESCGYEYFSAYDTFESIKIEQEEFYKRILDLIVEAKGNVELPDLGIGLIFDNNLNRYTLYSSLMIELIDYLEIPDLKYIAIENVISKLKENNYIPGNAKVDIWSNSSEEFRKKEKNNNLSELGLRLYISLFEVESGIKFYEENYYYKDKEIKLYVLVSILMSCKQKDQIVAEISLAISKGIEPRQKLLDLLDKIKTENILPKYL